MTETCHPAPEPGAAQTAAHTAAPPAVPPMPGGAWDMFGRLSLMMLLEFVVFGAWFATLGLVLATAGMAGIIGWAYMLSAVAAILSPLLSGAIGDRFLSAERLLALLHLLAALMLFAAPAALKAGAQGLVLLLVFLHMLAFMPTLGLVNAIALRGLGARAPRFPYVRVFGPLGWMLAGLVVGAMGLSAAPGVFTVAGVAGVVMAGYALTLPRMPPQGRGRRFRLGDAIGIDAIVLFRQRDFSVLILCALLTSISLGVYNTFAAAFLGALGIGNVAGVMALGQLSEVAFIVTIPVVLRRIGMKWALLAGMSMWGLRFALFALASESQPQLAVLGVALHGICNDFFIVVAAMYINRLAPPALAATAQGWLILVISGLGGVLGAVLAGQIFGRLVAPNLGQGAAAWAPLWLLPIGLALVTALLWLGFFRDPRPDPGKPQPLDA